MTLRDLPYSTSDLFPPGDFGFHMKFRRGEIARFYGRSPENEAILAERQKWLKRSPDLYARALPSAEPLLEEAIELADSLQITVRAGSDVSETILNLGGCWEPDLLILRAPSGASQPELLAGAVCFPSSWALEEKIGQALDFIHAPVPTLNDQFASPVQQFLARIKPGISWERINWGLSRSPELNQHPSRQLARLDAKVALEEVWFRAEYQSLAALPKSGGVLFGIRLVIEPLSRLRNDPVFASGLARAIQTMPEAIARYKGVFRARERLLELLT